MFSHNRGGFTKCWIEGDCKRCSLGGFFLLLWLSKEITARDGMDASNFTISTDQGLETQIRPFSTVCCGDRTFYVFFLYKPVYPRG